MQPSVKFWVFVWMCLRAAVDATLARLKLDTTTVISGIVLLLIGYLLFSWRRGKKDAQKRAWEEFLWGGAPLVIFALILFMLNSIRSPYLVYRTEHETARQLVYQADSRAEKAEDEKKRVASALEREKDKSQPKFEITHGTAVISDIIMTSKDKKEKYTNICFFLPVAVLNHGAQSIVRGWRLTAKLSDGTEAVGQPFVPSIPKIVFKARGRSWSFSTSQSLFRIATQSPIPNGGLADGFVMFLFPMELHEKIRTKGVIISLILYDITNKESKIEIPLDLVEARDFVGTPGLWQDR